MIDYCYHVEREEGDAAVDDDETVVDDESWPSESGYYDLLTRNLMEVMMRMKKKDLCWSYFEPRPVVDEPGVECLLFALNTLQSDPTENLVHLHLESFRLSCENILLLSHLTGCYGCCFLPILSLL